MNNFIHSFRVKNFFSFKEQSEFSFLVDKKAPQSDAYITADSGERISKVGMIIGANASGKTNLFRALELIKKMIAINALFKADSDKKDDSPLSPFASFSPFVGNEKEETELSITFNIGKKVYEYTVSFDNLNKVIAREIFTLTDKTQERKTKKEILSRVYDKDTKKTTVKFNKSRIQMPHNIEDALLPKIGIMSTLHNLDQNNVFGKEMSSFWSIMLPEVDEISNVLSRRLGKEITLVPFLSSILQFIRSVSVYEEFPEIEENMEEILKRFDTGVQKVTIKKNKELDDKGNKSERAGITTKHVIDGKLVDMDFIYDSAGTRQMYAILGNLLKTKRDGGLVAIDEIDINLHPLILSEIVSMFLGEVSNKKNAQFIFSSHAHLIMEDLDKHQIHIVQKDRDGRSEVYRLDSVKGVRSAENHFGKYLAGAYGGIPHIQ